MIIGRHMVHPFTTGGVMGSLEKESQVTWGKKFDEEFKSFLAMIEEYVKVRHGKDCTNLRLVLGLFM